MLLVDRQVVLNELLVNEINNTKEANPILNICRAIKKWPTY